MTAPGGLCRTPNCDTPVADAWVCTTCAHRLTVALGDAPDLLQELDVDLTRQARSGNRVGGRSTETPLPFDVDASIIRDVLTSTMRTWALVLAGDLLGEPPAAATLPAHLGARITHIRQHPDGGQIVDEITAAVTAARDHLHRSDRAPSILAGTCPDCGHTVYARQGDDTGHCRTPDCEGTVDVAAWRQTARATLPDRALPMAQLVRALAVLGHHVPEGTVKSWIRRGKLVSSGTEEGRRLYLVADAITLTTTRKTTAA